MPTGEEPAFSPTVGAVAVHQYFKEGHTDCSSQQYSYPLHPLPFYELPFSTTTLPKFAWMSVARKEEDREMETGLGNYSAKKIYIYKYAHRER